MNSSLMVMLIRGAAIFMAIGVSEVAIATNSCVVFPRESKNPVVEVCHNDVEITFRIVDDITRFESDQFKSRVMESIRAWLTKHGKSDALIDDSAVEIWMTVPESDPAAAQPRAVVTTSFGKLSFWFDLKAQEWILKDKETAVLGEQNYPDSFGYRPTRVLAKAQSGISGKQAKAALMDAGANGVTEQGGGWYAATCDVFQEVAVAERALKTHDGVLEYAQVNSVFEWIADRQKAFDFPTNQVAN